MRILIAGGGEVAMLIARRLIREGNEVVIIEDNPDRAAQLEELLDARIVQGNAARIRTLHEAGMREADMMIAVTSDDEVNVLACMAAQVEAPNIKVKVARLRTPEAGKWEHILKTVGVKIDLIIQTEIESAARVIPVLPVPGMSDMVEFANGQIRLFSMTIEADSWVAGKTIMELDKAGPPRNSLIAMIFRGPQVIIPHGGEVLLPEDHAYIVTRTRDVEAAMSFMGLHARKNISRVFILGGRQIGIWIAEELERMGVSVKLFERDARRSQKISNLLDKTIVIQGDGTDEATLMEENIQDVDAYLALTSDDEDNIIACLLARKLGARKVVALINRSNYLAMAQRLGIHTTVSPRLAAVDRILQFVRKGRVLSVTTFREEEAEAIELRADTGSPYVGKKLMDLRFPRGAIIGAIAREDGEVIVPRGDAVIRVGDRVIVFTLESLIPKLASAFEAFGKREKA